MDIWNRITDIPIVVMGGGPLEEEFSLWAEKKENVYFLGYTQHEKCLNIVKCSEFVLFPSIWYEGCSMVEIEAESLGKAIIATDLGFSTEAIENGVNGYKIKLGDVEGFTETIKKLWNDPVACRNLGVNARLSYESRYLPEDNFQQLIKIYESL
jgi:glycosyltransferase involved in cell wall biosynthesis